MGFTQNGFVNERSKKIRIQIKFLVIKVHKNYVNVSQVILRWEIVQKPQALGVVREDETRPTTRPAGSRLRPYQVRVGKGLGWSRSGTAQTVPRDGGVRDRGPTAVWDDPCPWLIIIISPSRNGKIANPVLTHKALRSGRRHLEPLGLLNSRFGGRRVYWDNL